MKTVYSEQEIKELLKSSSKRKFKFPRINIKDKLTFLIFKIIGAKWANVTVVNPNEWSDEFIMKTLKTNGFVELNRRGYFFINGFTLIELNKGLPKMKGRDVLSGEQEEKHIVEVFIKHDIDSSKYTNVKAVNIACKVTNLQNMINYFARL